MNINRALKTFGAQIYKNRATIETIAGMIAIAVGTGIVISKAKQAAEVSNELEKRFDDIHKKDATDAWVDKKERSAAVRGALMYGAKGYSKAYWLGITFEIGGMVLIAVSDITQAKELSATSALLATTSATLSAVKERVIADQGEEKWQEYLLGPQFTTVDVLPDGTIIQTTNPLENPNQDLGLPPHCVFFDECNAPENWEPDARMNRDFLESHQRWLSEKLWAEGFLFENDIRRDLGLPLTKSGWTSGILCEDKDGNRQYVDLGLGAKNPAAQAFRDGANPSILLQLNVEDNIIDQMNWHLI